MNKQNQELRSLSQIVQENIAADELSSENLEVLSESPLYSNSYAVDQYKDLLKVIDFTKIADMLHLITHYGAVSAEQIRNFEKSSEVKCIKYLAKYSSENSSQKKLEELLIRKLRTDKYLQYYDLQEIDLSLNEMFPNPIGYDERRWYTVASEMLLNEFRRIDLKIDDRSDCLYFTNDYGERQFVSEFSIGSFAEFLMIMMHTSKIFDYQLDWTKQDLTRLVMSFSTDRRFRTNESQEIED